MCQEMKQSPDTMLLKSYVTDRLQRWGNGLMFASFQKVIAQNSLSNNNYNNDRDNSNNM